MSKEIEVFATTDIHGAFESFKESKTVSRLKRSSPEAIWIDNGDFFIGNALSTYYNTTHKISPFVYQANTFGYDVMVPGNHDFDYGLAYLKRQVSELTMPYVCCNLFDRNDKYLFPPYTVVERGENKIAVIGLMTQALPQLGEFEAIKDVICKKTVPSLKETIQALPSEIDFIVIAYHGGLQTDPLSGKNYHYHTGEDQAYELAASIDCIDGMVIGHQHFVNKGKIKQTTFVQPGHRGEQVGYLRLGKNGSERTDTSSIIEVEVPCTKSNIEFEAWMNEPVDLLSLNVFLKEYFSVSKEELLFTFSGSTRQDLLESFPIPYTFSYYHFPLEEWEVIKQEKWIPKEIKAGRIEDGKKMLYSNDRRLPYYRVKHHFIAPLFDAYHRWLKKKA